MNRSAFTEGFIEKLATEIDPRNVPRPKPPKPPKTPFPKKPPTLPKGHVIGGLSPHRDNPPTHDFAKGPLRFKSLVEKRDVPPLAQQVGFGTALDYENKADPRLRDPNYLNASLARSLEGAEYLYGTNRHGKPPLDSGMFKEYLVHLGLTPQEQQDKQMGLLLERERDYYDPQLFQDKTWGSVPGQEGHLMALPARNKETMMGGAGGGWSTDPYHRKYFARNQDAYARLLSRYVSSPEAKAQILEELGVDPGKGPFYDYPKTLPRFFYGSGLREYPETHAGRRDPDVGRWNPWSGKFERYGDEE